MVPLFIRAMTTTDDPEIRVDLPKAVAVQDVSSGILGTLYERLSLVLRILTGVDDNLGLIRSGLLAPLLVSQLTYLSS